MSQKIAILGAGNMGSPIAISMKEIFPEIHVYDRNPEKCQSLKDKYNITSFIEYECNIKYDCVLIAIKPDQIQSNSNLISSMLTNNALVISVAAGIEIEKYKNFFDKKFTIVRAMPTIAAKYKSSSTAAFCEQDITNHHKEFAHSILSSFGKVVWLDKEEHMHIATAIAGSAIAYYFNFIKHQVDIAKNFGLSESQANKLTEETIQGAAIMIKQEHLSMEQLIRLVTSPNGVTESALKAMESAQINQILLETINAAITRSKELGE